MDIWHRQITVTMIRRSFNKTLYNNVYPQYKPPKNKTTMQQNAKWAVCDLSVYRFVFTTNLAFGATLLLCISLLLQPVNFVYAQETSDQLGVETTTTNITDQTTASEGEAAIASNQADETMNNYDDSLAPENETFDDDVSPDDAQSPSEPQGDASDSNTTPTLATSTSEATVESIANVSQSGVDSATSSTETATDSIVVASTPSPSLPADDEEGVDSATTTTEQSSSVATDTILDNATDSATPGSGTLDNVAESDSATTAPPDSQVVSTVQTDNVLAFKKNECTEVEDGSFYCQKVSYDTMAKNDLFAAPDATGDMEIYVVQDGAQIKITDNAADDASPYYDASSKTIVWHRLINDRYQIMSYDVETGDEQQITNTSVNDMEPTRNGEYTVWQRWVQNNWEIILQIGDTQTQITDSVEHDIAPHIRGDLVIWNVRSSDGTQSLMTYDISSQVFNEIKDTDGVSVSNPRMLVMYEAQYQNGDIVMKGYDLVTGEIIPIERFPQDVPTDIPSPETTGEVRALPTNPQLEEELSVDTDLDTDEPDQVPIDYEEGDLVLSASTTASTTPIGTADSYDLDLRPIDEYKTSTTNDLIVEQAAIPDVVIAKFNQNNDSMQASSTQDN